MEKGKVLIVDDDPMVRDVLSDILTNICGFSTNVAVNGVEGVAMINSNDYDIVFTDLTMPKMGGMDLLRETRKTNPSVPVVVITGFSTMDNAVSAMREGAKDFVTKPFKIDVVTSIADRILGEKKLLSKITQNSDYENSISMLNAELFRKLQEINIFQSISSELDGLYDNKEIYGRIVEMVSRLLLVKEASFGIIENGCLKIKKAIGAQERDVPYVFENSALEKVVKTKQHYIASFGEVNPLTGIPLTSPFFIIPMTINNEVFGLLTISGKADSTMFTDDEVSLALTFAKKTSQRIENNALYEVFYNNMISTLKSLVISIEAKDIYTKNHSERVTYYALQIADIMKLAEDDKDAIRFGGYLHDIGKIGVRDTVLLKPGRLTDEEMGEIRLHPVIGGNIIKPIRFFPKERELILHHHENFNGTGYPDGLAGDKIPLVARILTIADTYDAMTSSRPYRNALSHEIAIKEINRCSGTQFDNEVVRAFMQTETGRGKKYGN
jgi:response regulator RpfG family c-di-GMP phosphodiesterase